MKILMALLTLFSLSTIACPDLNGTYKCSDEEQSYDMIIVQKGTSFSIIDDEGEEVLTADGQAYDYQSDNFKGEKAAICQNGSLIFEMVGNITEEGQQIPIALHGAFEQTSTGIKIVVNFLTTENTFSSETSCTKVK